MCANQSTISRNTCIKPTLRRNLKRSQPKGTEIKVTTKIEAGGPQESVCTLLEKSDIGLIVMTAVGRKCFNTCEVNAIIWNKTKAIPQFDFEKRTLCLKCVEACPQTVLKSTAVEKAEESVPV